MLERVEFMLFVCFLFFRRRGRYFSQCVELLTLMLCSILFQCLTMLSLGFLLMAGNSKEVLSVYLVVCKI